MRLLSPSGQGLAHSGLFVSIEDIGSTLVKRLEERQSLTVESNQLPGGSPGQNPVVSPRQMRDVQDDSVDSIDGPWPSSYGHNEKVQDWKLDEEDEEDKSIASEDFEAAVMSDLEMSPEPVSHLQAIQPRRSSQKSVKSLTRQDSIDHDHEDPVFEEPEDQIESQSEIDPITSDGEAQQEESRPSQASTLETQDAPVESDNGLQTTEPPIGTSVQCASELVDHPDISATFI